MIPWITIAKLAAVLGMVAAVIGGIWYGAHAIHADGRTVERAEWLEEEAAASAQAAENVRTAVIAVQQYRDKQEKNLNEVINAKDQAITRLQKAERDAVAANRGLWISAAACSGNNAVPATTNGAGIVASGTGRVRLSGQDEHDIRAAFGDAQRVVIQYNACRARLKSIATVADSQPQE